LDVFRR